MAAPTGAEALKIALSDWRRNAAALLSGAVVVAAAVAVGTREAYYLAALILFTIWMVWFTLAGIDWVKVAEF
jgi:hypothetical protein